MFRRKSQPPPTTFNEAFWVWYNDSYKRNAAPVSDSISKPVLRRYSSSLSEVTTIIKYFERHKLEVPTVSQVTALLKSPFTQGDLVRTFHFIRFFQLSTEGYFITNDGFDKSGDSIAYVGAENWENVMCYLDALLFSMFANLESFEPILFISNQHSNYLVNQLAALIRLYVNFLRSGNLITTDITTRICEVLMKLGFNEAMSHKQQDSARLFEFLTETLAMPLLTFKIDIKHAGKFDKDDQKYAKERILFVSLPEDDDLVPADKLLNDHVEDAGDEILLEECLEHYFNNSISVRRELQRRATLESKNEPGDINIADSSIALTRTRAESNSRFQTRTRSSTLSFLSTNSANEVSLPAWMLLRLLPFYTDDNPGTASDSDEFVKRRPILPICLKRYSFNAASSQAFRSQRKIIVPPLIDLPYFIADEDNDNVQGNYRLILESVVCHRGTSISSGHFVSAVRRNTHKIHETEEEASNAPWYLYDDMKKQGRVVEKTFNDIFNTEWPYILFYRLVSLDSSSSASSIVIPPKGSRSKFWSEEALSPIMSENNSEKDVSLSSKLELSKESISDRQSTVSSIPMPEVLPADKKFLDIRDKYFWYVPDANKNYHKEEVTKVGQKDSISSQYRRNSQWSDQTAEPKPFDGISIEEASDRLRKLSLSKIQSKDPSLEPSVKSEKSDKSERSEFQEIKLKTKSPAQLIKSLEGRNSSESKKHLHHIFSHEARSRRAKRREDYKKEKCVIV